LVSECHYNYVLKKIVSVSRVCIECDAFSKLYPVTIESSFLSTGNPVGASVFIPIILWSIDFNDRLKRKSNMLGFV